MEARTAYTQLHHSPLLLAVMLAGMALTFLAPPLVALVSPLYGNNIAAIIGFTAWFLMALTAWPTYRLYRQPVWTALILPVPALFYCAMTLDSALRHWRRAGGAWKGRMHPRTRKVE